MKNSQQPIYLDHNAGTPILPEVVDAMLPYLREHFGNPSSTHAYGKTMHAAVERAREQVSRLIDCIPNELYFTSGGTEANNLAIRGVCAAVPDRRHILTSVIEHPATAEPCAWLEEQGYTVFRAPVDDAGRVMAERVQEVLGQDGSGKNWALVSVMHANSETGTLQAIAEIADMAQHCSSKSEVDNDTRYGFPHVLEEMANCDQHPRDVAFDFPPGVTDCAFSSASMILVSRRESRRTSSKRSITVWSRV